MRAPAPAEPRQLLAGTLVAVSVAAVVLVVAVLPAEYGIDPTGLGAATGLARLSGTEGDGPLVEAQEPEGEGALYRMEATWTLLSLPLAQQEGRVTGADAQTQVALPLNVTNLTSVSATLAWDDAAPADARRTGTTLEISIEAPNGMRSQAVQATSDPGGRANATATLNLRPVPFPETNDSTGLRISLAEDTTGVGAWTFHVRLREPGGAAAPTDAAFAQDWTLAVAGEIYELDLRTEAQREGDRVQITLRPDQGIEYKLRMEPGATLRYAWTSTAPVRYDFHGEEDGKAADDFTSFATGTAREAEGSHTAPFPGTHGWYFANINAEPVVITLTTRGAYSIVGVPR